MLLLLLQVGAPSKVKEAPLVLKALYDADVTEEDIILAWHDKQDAAKVSFRVGYSCVQLNLGLERALCVVTGRRLGYVTPWFCSH